MADERQDELPWRLDPETKKIVSLDGRPLDPAFWLSRPAAERWMALEVLRRAEWGEAATAPMQKVLEIIEVDWK
jgi:hypothetical protein